MAKQRNIWKFNEDDWKVHITDRTLLDKIRREFEFRDVGTIYYGNGGMIEETAWDIIVPDNMINKVKKYIKENS
jgi:hypothetical protein